MTVSLNAKLKVTILLYWIVWTGYNANNFCRFTKPEKLECGIYKCIKCGDNKNVLYEYLSLGNCEAACV